MKKITLILFALFTCWQINAQSIVIGTGTGTTTSSGSDPIDGYYGSFRYQVVYTAAELSATLTPYDEITGLGFSIAGDYGGGDLLGYTIKMGHTSAINSATHNASVTTVVKAPFNYNPTVTADGVFDMITFDSNFTWNGVDNVLVEICSDGPNAYVSPYGQVRMTTMTTGSRYYRVDGGVSCNVNTGTTNGNRPNIQFNYVDGTPPACLAPNALTATNLTSASAQLGWTENGTATLWNIEYGVSGFTPGAGTTLSGVTNSYLLNGLTSNTIYQYYVQADCGGTFSSWAGPFTFRTPCTAINTFPFVETFDVASTTESCWSVIDGNADADLWNMNGTTIPRTGQAAELYTDYNTVNNDYLVTPQLNIGSVSKRLKFWVRHYSNTEPDNLNVKLSTTDGNIASFTNTLLTLSTTQITTTYTEYVVDLSAYSGLVYIAFARESAPADGWYISIDDVTVEDIPSCVEPNTILASNITASTVDLSWTDGSGGLQFDYEYAIQAPGTGVPATAGAQIDAVTIPGEGFDINGNPLTANTLYEVYVRADCGGGDFSTWVGPITFRTLCNAVGTINENFDSVTTPALPDCWSKILRGTTLSSFATVTTTANTTNSAPNSAALYNSSSATTTTDDIILVSPVLSNLSAGTHRLKFYAKTTGSIQVGTLNNNTGTAVFTPFQTIATTATSTLYVVDFSTYAGTDTFIGFRHNSGTFVTIYIDDVVWEPIPATAPSCASNIVATPNASCGNFANSITWDATPNADGYYITVGTTSGGTDVANASSITTNTYSFSGNIGTTYFYTIVPFNAIGSATGCTEQSFTTNASGCYCVSAPTSVDGTGITNVQLVATNFANTVSTAPVYNDHTATVVDMSQGISNSVQITFNTDSFGTSYDYNTVIWIDVNDNFTFEPSEIVFTGVSAAVSPTILNASFVMPGTAPLGQHRMRIVATDALQTPANPCYSGSYGETADFTVNVVAATCTPPAATTSIVPACGTTQFSIDVNVTALGSGTPSISNGTTTWPVSAIGVVNVGPFASGSSVTLTLLHGSDVTCNLPLGTFTYVCPPVNDDCANAISVLTMPYSNTQDASAATGPVVSTCTGMNDGVWYTVVGNGADIIVDVTAVTGWDPELGVYTGSCGTFTCVASIDNGGTSAGETYTIVSSILGTTYYINVGHYSSFGDSPEGPFTIGVTTTLSSGSFDNANFSAYPNPVKDVLNVSYTSEISSVKIINMLGQEVISKKINATSSQIDMSQLSAGTYIVNVTVGDTIKTLKVVKQ